MSDRTSQTTHETLRQARRSVPVPLWGTGTAQGYTDEEGVVEVLLDGPESVSTDEDDLTEDPNAPVFASVLCGSVADQEKVRTVFTPDGSLFVVGSMGGQPRVIGGALIEGGATDFSVASTVQVPIDNLRAEATVQHPGHLIRIDTNIFLQSGAAANTLIGRIRREDQAGSNEEVGRFLRSTGLANNETIMAGVPCFDYSPEPGGWIYWPSVEASVTGWTIITDPNTTPIVAAAVVVTDCGALPPGLMVNS